VPVAPSLIHRAAFAAFLACTAPALADGRAGDFDFYVLSLTWAPAYCAGENPDPAECASRPRGFVLHRLWPQYETGYPDYCPSSEPRWLDDGILAAIADVMRSAGFAGYQWRKHGLCSGLAAGEYFATMRHAFAAVAIPPRYAGPPADVRVSPAAIETAFVAANPGLTTDAMSVQCRKGRLTEIRICFTKELTFRRCLEVDDDTCRSTTIVVPAVQ
jgi:ribonuclease T2